VPIFGSRRDPPATETTTCDVTDEGRADAVSQPVTALLVRASHPCQRQGDTISRYGLVDAVVTTIGLVTSPGHKQNSRRHPSVQQAVVHVVVSVAGGSLRDPKIGTRLFGFWSIEARA
jgi:hypothetical protein